MSSRLLLHLPYAFGGHAVEVDSKRFSIGRTPENDLVIDDASLSRRHALIETIDGTFYLSDCGSSNGTFVNGRQISELTELCDWDVLTFAEIGEIVVRVSANEESAKPLPQVAAINGGASVALPSQSSNQVHGALSSESPTQSWWTPPAIAAASAVVIVVVTVVALAITWGWSNRRSPSKPLVQRATPPNENLQDERNPNLNTAGPPESPSPSRDVGPISVNEIPDLSIIEGYASKVLMASSKDQHPVLAEGPIREINAQVRSYRGSSTLRDELQAMKRVLPQVSAAAKSSGIRPALAVYATLANIDKGGGRGDPAQVAAQLCPILGHMRVLFGDELANDSLLAVAALEEGPGLQLRITRLAGHSNESVTTIRSIWYLREHQVLSPAAYDLVRRFLAIGVVAQNPRKFGVDADPLDF